MSSIDLVILGMVSEKPQSAYDIQKDVEYHHLSRWTKISIPSVYKKVLRLQEDGYLQSENIQGEKSAPKTIYSITEKGKEYFSSLMEYYDDRQIPFLFDFNVMVTNLNKIEKEQALSLIKKLRLNITATAETVEKYAEEFSTIPLVGRTIFDQQKLLCDSLIDWVDNFERQFKEI